MGGIAQNASENVTVELHVGNQPSHSKHKKAKAIPRMEQGGLTPHQFFSKNLKENKSPHHDPETVWP